jgi:hypothetical protein
MDGDEVVRRLINAMDEYDRQYPCYDEVFWQAHDRIRECGEASKLDLAALFFWKRARRARWTSELMSSKTDADVRARTRAAFKPGLSDQERLDALADGGFPGFRAKAAISTVVLACFDPSDYGVLDERAFEGLKTVGWPVKRGRGETLHYLERLRELRDLVRNSRSDVTGRQIDQALWMIGGE